MATTIRPATPADAPALLEIYRYYTLNTAISFEIDPPTLKEFEARIKKTLLKYPYIVAEEPVGTAGSGAAHTAEARGAQEAHAVLDHGSQEGPRILGYAYAGPFVGRAAYSHCAELTIYLDPACRHKGLGRRLYEELERRLKGQGILNLYACIGYPTGAEDEYLTTNSADFHEHMGFTLAGRFRKCGRKFGRWYDMIWMEKLLDEAN